MQMPLFELESDWQPPAMSELPSWAGVKRIAIDIETCDPHLKKRKGSKGTGPSIRTGGFICGVAFAIEDGPSYYLPIRHLGGDNLPVDGVLNYLCAQAAQYKGVIVGANFNYDLDYLAQEGIIFSQVKWCRDVQIADPLINELHLRYSLQAIAERWGLPGKDNVLLGRAAAHYGYKDVGQNMWKLPARFVGAYGEQDVKLPLQLLRKQERRIDELKLWEVYNLESELQPVLLKMRRRGVKIDQTKLSEIEQWALDEERCALDEVHARTGVRIKVGDTSKKGPVSQALAKIGVVLKETTSGQAQIDKEVLAAIDHPVAHALAHAKEVNHLRTSFVKSIWTHMVKGRVHTTFNQLRREKKDGDHGGARYGRTSSENPNLQNQPNPKRSEVARQCGWRNIYIPDHPDQLWLSADYSQQEPRMLTHFAELYRFPGADVAADRYRNDPKADNHTMMTTLIHPQMANVDEEDMEFQVKRSQCKNIFLGLIYRMGGAKLARDLGLPTAKKRLHSGIIIDVAGPEAQHLLDTFNARLPYVNGLAERCTETANRRGWIRTLSGRLCHFPKKEHGGFDWTYRAINRLIQGSSGDQTKRALVEIDKAGLPLQLQIHDEVDSTIDDLEQAHAIAEIMETCTPLNVPSKVDIDVGPSWGQAKGIA